MKIRIRQWTPAPIPPHSALPSPHVCSTPQRSLLLVAVKFRACQPCLLLQELGPGAGQLLLLAMEVTCGTGPSSKGLSLVLGAGLNRIWSLASTQIAVQTSFSPDLFLDYSAFIAKNSQKFIFLLPMLHRTISKSSSADAGPPHKNLVGTMGVLACIGKCGPLATLGLK